MMQPSTALIVRLIFELGSNLPNGNAGAPADTIEEIGTLYQCLHFQRMQQFLVERNRALQITHRQVDVSNAVDTCHRSLLDDTAWIQNTFWIHCALQRS